jgi:tRNA-uridine 2-sulfurtransferase
MRKIVAVGLSGGVDSALAAALLKEAGHEVHGVIMTTWDGRPLPAEGPRHGCYGPGEKEDVEDAARIAAALGIPFHVIDLARQFNDAVLAPCARDYLCGVTPNPCIHCNRLMKFARIPAELATRGLAIDYFATGHYAVVAHGEGGARHRLLRGKDRAKDQSYFLALLTQEQLGRALFPLGAHTKAEVRCMAAARGLPVAQKPESQDFISGGYHTIFGASESPGPVIDEQGHGIATHRGIQFYTIGQRKGLGIAHGTPIYVIAIDAAANTVVVGPEEKLYSTELSADGLNWIAVEALAGPMRVLARIRYRHEGAPATIEPEEGGLVRVRFDSPQRAITPGQAVVFYDGDAVVGGGIIRPPAAVRA